MATTNQQTNKDKMLDFLREGRNFHECRSKFKFWNGVSFGLCVAEIGTMKQPIFWIVLAMFCCATAISWVWYGRAKKSLNKMDGIL